MWKTLLCLLVLELLEGSAVDGGSWRSQRTSGLTPRSFLVRERPHSGKAFPALFSLFSSDMQKNMDARGGGSLKLVPYLEEERFEEAAPILTNVVLQLHTGSNSTVSKARRLFSRDLEARIEHQQYERGKENLKNRNSMNIRRKVLHACFGIAFGFLNQVVRKGIFVPVMGSLTSLVLVVELFRYRSGMEWMNEIMHSILGSSLRKHEMNGKFTGSFYFFFGVTMTAVMFPKAAATLGICQLALVDPAASYFGRLTRHIYWSRIENGLGGLGRNKGFLGFLGGALFVAPFNYRVLQLANRCYSIGTPMRCSGHTLIIASFLLGLAGSLADLAVPTPAIVMPERVLGVSVPPFHLDDNTFIPICSAAATAAVFVGMGWPSDPRLASFLVI